MTAGKAPQAETIAGLNVTFLVAALLLVGGVIGSALAVPPYEDPFKISLFLMGFAGSLGSFIGLLAFHRRRVAATGDPRTTLYSAFAIYSALFFSVLFGALAVVILGRAISLVPEQLANRISYFFITDVIVLVFLLGAACLYDRKNPGLLALKIYLWPWSYLLATIRRGDAPASDSRNDADRNPETYDRETDHGETPEEERDVRSDDLRGG